MQFIIVRIQKIHKCKNLEINHFKLYAFLNYKYVHVFKNFEIFNLNT